MNVIVIGGGASGMTAAITSRRCGNNVTIIEKNKILGKKLLLTGNGRCNYFNEDMRILNFYSNGDASRFINEKNLDKLNSFFNTLGFIPRIKDGYYYPYSNIASSIQNTLLKEIQVLGITIINEEVKDIKKNEKFIIYTNDNSYECDKLILSTGGMSYSKTGSDGFGYKLLSTLGHKIVPIKPGLVPLISAENVSAWKGIRAQVKANLFVDGILVSTQSGEAQLTEYGISGICIMNLSRFVSLEKENILSLNFLPFVDNLYEFMEKRNNVLKNRTIIELLEEVINYKLLYFIMQKLHVDVNYRWNDLDSKSKNLLINNLNNFKIRIIDTKGYDYAEVTTGGLDLNEVSDNTESKIIKNLFITGELLDIDGVCGGYNLTNAWITGILAGENK